MKTDAGNQHRKEDYTIHLNKTITTLFLELRLTVLSHETTVLICYGKHCSKRICVALKEHSIKKLSMFGTIDSIRKIAGRGD